jgi:hypothetical protein
MKKNQKWDASKVALVKLAKFSLHPYWWGYHLMYLHLQEAVAVDPHLVLQASRPPDPVVLNYEVKFLRRDLLRLGWRVGILWRKGGWRAVNCGLRWLRPRRPLQIFQIWHRKRSRQDINGERCAHRPV